jgi:Txe/YoeB family toxin of Txe-Axe toxin-antitoxin module
MIDEQFLQSAVNIRREYLKISNNLDFYQKRAKQVVEKIESTITELGVLQTKINNKEISSSSESVKNLIEILKNVEEEGNALEKLANPMNGKIEKLAKEEQELYSRIITKHSNMTEEQIIADVKKRLESEKLV